MLRTKQNKLFNKYEGNGTSLFEDLSDRNCEEAEIPEGISQLSRLWKLIITTVIEVTVFLFQRMNLIETFILIITMSIPIVKLKSLVLLSLRVTNDRSLRDLNSHYPKGIFLFLSNKESSGMKCHIQHSHPYSYHLF